MLRQRMEVARSHGDQPGLETLSDENRHYQWFGEVPVPDAMRDAVDVFAVAAEDKPIRAVAFGDFGTGQEAQVKTAAAIGTYGKDHPLDFGLTLGDNFYGRGMASPSDPAGRRSGSSSTARWGSSFMRASATTTTGSR
jgi:tartrate-resistant acid phosphatase type 5